MCGHLRTSLLHPAKFLFGNLVPKRIHLKKTDYAEIFCFEGPP